MTVIVLMGVTSSGKSTIGHLLAQRLGAELAEGDAYHPPANVAKMSRGQPLEDADRLPWLQAIATDIAHWSQAGRTVIVTCSALKRAYRDVLRSGGAPRFVHLTGSPELLRARMEARRDHFMPVSLLPSQLATLEAPAPEEQVLAIDVAEAPAAIVERIIAWLERG
jgi:gluconokinase